jgi:hypothetical protein
MLVGLTIIDPENLTAELRFTDDTEHCPFLKVDVLR